MQMKPTISMLSQQEKLDLMEALWVDLTRNAESFDSPQWHAQELSETERRVANGDEQFIEWEKAKQKILSSHK
jgi:hypothetical protein